MDDPLRIISEAEGVFLRREALECGYSDKAIRARLRAREWHRVRHGAYCFRDQIEPLYPEQRHLLLARAVLRTTPGPIALSHTTALLAHGVAVWGAPLHRVHVTRLDDGAARLERDVVHHVGQVRADEEVDHVDGMPVVGVARAVIEAASILGTESALVSADSSLHKALCTPEELHARFAACHHWPGSQKIHIVLNRMDGRHESPGETRSAYLFWRQGLPQPEPQWEIYDHHGILVACVDFAWPWLGVFGEFDGAVKYGKLLKPGQSPEDAVIAEKDRENLVRELTGWLCGRLVNSDLAAPGRTAERFRRLFRQAERAGAGRRSS
jgi:hypothetical protein